MPRKPPTNGTTVTDDLFDYSLTSAWTGNTITFDPNAKTPATTAVPHEYFYFHPATNHVTVGKYTLAVESLAMAIYCTVKYFNNFEQAMIASVNHRGDSDSVGAVTGNILGVVVGYDAIQQSFKDNLELHDVILHVADDIWNGETTNVKSNKKNSKRI